MYLGAIAGSRSTGDHCFSGKVKFMEGVEVESLKDKGLVYYPKKAKVKLN